MREKVNELIKLMNDNPELDVKFAVGYEVCGGDECNYWLATEVSTVKVDYFYLDDERWYSGKDNILERLVGYYEDTELTKDMTNLDFDCFIENEFELLLKQNKIIKSIIVYLDV